MYMQRMSRKVWSLLLLGAALTPAAPPPLKAADTALPTIRADVDATDLARHLLRSKLTIPVDPGPLALWFPEWIPGIHGPSEQIRNLGGLVITTDSGERLHWQRDRQRMNRFELQVPEGVSAVHVELTYIANQPTRVSRGVDTFGNSQLAVLSPNTCLLYPEGVRNDQLKVALRVRVPEGWRVGAGLPHRVQDGWHTFEVATLQAVIDTPILAAEHARTLAFSDGSFPAVEYHLASESAAALRLDDPAETALRQLVLESAALFQDAPFEKYTFLVICSDQLPRMGLEHLTSSLNGVPERGLVDEKKRKDTAAYLLPHEFVHAWCGKYRRPASMVTYDYHTPKQTTELWIYEGLTQYLGEVLAVRSGLWTLDEYRDEHLTPKVGRLASRAGRRWRSLQDTAVAGHTLRGGSRYWNDWRRDQDYYNEGALFWLEVDAILRTESRDAVSLDDFCRQFFANRPGPRQHVVPFQIGELVTALEKLAPYDWNGLIQRRIEVPLEELPLDVIDRVGYRLQYVAERPEDVRVWETDRKVVSAEYSLGLTVDNEGKITRVIPNRPADATGLAQGMQIVGVNDKKFQPQRLRDAIADSTTRRNVELLVLDGESFRRFDIRYADGPRYLQLVRNSDRSDLLAKIYAPLRSDDAAAE